MATGNLPSSQDYFVTTDDMSVTFDGHVAELTRLEESAEVVGHFLRADLYTGLHNNLVGVIAKQNLILWQVKSDFSLNLNKPGPSLTVECLSRQSLFHKAPLTYHLERSGCFAGPFAAG